MGDVFSFLKAFGITKGLFALFFIGAHYWLYRSNLGRLEDRQREIDRVAAENREYRDRFMKLIDEKFKTDSSGGEAD